ncbi:MAG: hypothetical protein Q7J27_04840 [Syntrophales bacterium]|nr:hypothetical protein [Syntrophales bacterium]
MSENSSPDWENKVVSPEAGAWIEFTDRQIDRLIYELYDLTKEEIEIIEG